MRCGKAKIAAGNNGFTLLEILLAFLIFSILFITLYSTYSGSFNTVNLTEARMEIYRKAAIAMDRVSEDLQATYVSVLPPDSFGEPAEHTRFLGEDNVINGREADSISFFARMGSLFGDDEGNATGQKITFEVQQGPGENELVLLRSENPEFTDVSEETGGQLLCDGLQAVEFAFFDDDGQSHENWDSESEEFAGLPPRMVSVTLKFLNHENPDAPTVFMTAVALPANYLPEAQGEGQQEGE